MRLTRASQLAAGVSLWPEAVTRDTRRRVRYAGYNCRASDQLSRQSLTQSGASPPLIAALRKGRLIIPQAGFAAPWGNRIGFRRSVMP
jgi:hypothetical protein